MLKASATNKFSDFVELLILKKVSKSFILDFWNLLFSKWDYLYRSLCHSGWQEKGRPVQGQQAAEENYETEIWWQRKYVTMFLWHEYVLFFKLAQNMKRCCYGIKWGHKYFKAAFWNVIPRQNCFANRIKNQFYINEY